MIFTLFSISLCLSAQQLVQGFYVLSSGDTVKSDFVFEKHGLRKLEDLFYFQEKIKYKSQDGKKQLILPETVKSVVFYIRKDTLILIPKVLEGKDKPIFVQRILHGKLELYRYFDEANFAGGMAPGGSIDNASFSHIITVLAYAKDGGPLFEPGQLNFKKNMTAYLSDCVVLVDKIRNWSLNDPEAIVNEYNQRCGR